MAPPAPPQPQPPAPVYQQATINTVYQQANGQYEEEGTYRYVCLCAFCVSHVALLGSDLINYVVHFKLIIYILMNAKTLVL